MRDFPRVRVGQACSFQSFAARFWLLAEILAHKTGNSNPDRKLYASWGLTYSFQSSTAHFRYWQELSVEDWKL